MGKLSPGPVPKDSDDSRQLHLTAFSERLSHTYCHTLNANCRIP